MGVDRPLASCKMPQTACGTPLHEAGGALGGRLNRCRVRPTGLSSTAQATFMLTRKYDVSRATCSPHYLIDSQNLYGALPVVLQYMNTHFSANISKPLCRKVRSSHPRLKRAERILHCLSP